MQEFCEQFFGKFGTLKKFEVGHDFYFKIHVQIAISLPIFDRFLQIRVKKFKLAGVKYKKSYIIYHNFE